MLVICPKVALLTFDVPGDTTGDRGVVELRMIERVEEFGSERQRCVFANAANLGRLGQTTYPN